MIDWQQNTINRRSPLPPRHFAEPTAIFYRETTPDEKVGLKQFHAI
jgi:hypothetical protein